MRRKTNQRKQAKVAKAIALRRQDYSQEEVAEILGVDVKTIQNYERDIREAGDFCTRGLHNWVVEKMASLTPMPGGYMGNSWKKRTCRDCGELEVTAHAVGGEEFAVSVRS